ncbi:hypothetical protein I314_04887 [Cryptococcus bacillisporus CA1873]|uniref:Uncharacterized protein n=1 Tax=Cryptococcus bacillisporus CA1873 TaxID=1296111 RepID=A0ABR5B6Y8_CRYGA|nr:hypothetical protein I314_04887 [Cryptococcus bacillisporus CA1873]|eukprot:KIR59365.1 hypothetical protein I314_04887 [Cryptococcus gattii CA1873]
MALITEMESGDWRTYKNADPLVSRLSFSKQVPNTIASTKSHCPCPFTDHSFFPTPSNVILHPSSSPCLLRQGCGAAQRPI